MQFFLSMTHGVLEKFAHAFGIEPERNINPVINFLIIQLNLILT